MDEEKRERREEIEVHETGRKGGAAAMAGVPAAEREAAMFWTRDLVRWGPIWAGLLIALAIQVVLGAIGLAVALSAYDVNSANYADQVANTLSIWSAISALVALFVGGYIAGRMAAVLGLRNGFIQGTVVWALALFLGVVLSALGVAGLLGGALNISPLIARGMDLSTAEAQRLVRGTASGAWWFVVGAILAWAAAAGGGILGTGAHEEAIERT